MHTHMHMHKYTHTPPCIELFGDQPNFVSFSKGCHHIINLSQPLKMAFCYILSENKI